VARFAQATMATPSPAPGRTRLEYSDTGVVTEATYTPS
jgi:hypothetical protein